MRSLTGFALMFSVLTMAVAVSFLYVGPGPLVPALDSYWIKIHVQAAIWGSSLFALGGIATIAYLIVVRAERRKLAALGSQSPPPITLPARAVASHSGQSPRVCAILTLPSWCCRTGR